MTFLELQTDVLFNSFSERMRPAARRALNAAVADICRRLQLFETQAVVEHDSSGVVALDNVFRIVNVSSADGPATTDPQAVRRQSRYALPPVGMLQSAADVEGRRGDGGTQAYTYRAKTSADAGGLVTRVEVYPVTVSGFVAVTALTRPPLMAADDDESGLSVELDEALIAFARMKVFQLEDDFAAAQQWQAEYERVLRNHREETSGSVITPGDEAYL